MTTRTSPTPVAILTALALGCHGGPPAASQETAMHASSLDVTSHPERRFRIDAFSVPAASRAEFEAAMHRNLAFIAKQPGFVQHVVFEKTTGPTTFDIVTMAVWDSQSAIDAASVNVRAYYQQIGFDMPATLSRLGITASLGYYQAPASLQ